MPDLLPAALDDLAVRYRDIVAEHAAGRLDLADAAAQIAELEADDQAGQRWSVAADTGQFLCTPPGGQPTPSPSSRFVTGAGAGSLLPATQPETEAPAKPAAARADWELYTVPGRSTPLVAGALGAIGQQPIVPGALGIDGSREQPGAGKRRRWLLISAVAAVAAAVALAAVLLFALGRTPPPTDVGPGFPTDHSQLDTDLDTDLDDEQFPLAVDDTGLPNTRR